MMRKVLFTASFILIMSLAMLGLTRGGLLTKGAAKVATNTSNSESTTNLSEPASANAASGEPVGISPGAEPLSTCCDSVKPVAVNLKLRYLGFSEGSHVVELTFDYVLSSCTPQTTINASNFRAPLITLNFANGVKRERLNTQLTGYARFTSAPQSPAGTCIMSQITIPGQPGDGQPLSYFVSAYAQVTVVNSGGGAANGTF